MSKTVLDIDYDYDFDLIGICSNAKDFKLAWSLNQELQLNLERDLKDFSIILGKKTSHHVVFRYHCEETHASYELIKNKGTGGLLIPEKAQINYFLLVYDYTLQSPTDVSNSVKQITVVSISMVINAEELMNKENLITA